MKHQRISEIARQVANESELYCVNKFDTDSDTNQFFAAVFAELIVRECIEQCERNFAKAIGTHASAHNTAVNRCISNIKKHFEIE